MRGGNIIVCSFFGEQETNLAGESLLTGRVIPAKSSEPQAVNSKVMGEGSGVANPYLIK